MIIISSMVSNGFEPRSCIAAQGDWSRRGLCTVKWCSARCFERLYISNNNLISSIGILVLPDWHINRYVQMAQWNWRQQQHQADSNLFLLTFIIISRQFEFGHKKTHFGDSIFFSFSTGQNSGFFPVTGFSSICFLHLIWFDLIYSIYILFQSETMWDGLIGDSQWV